MNTVVLTLIVLLSPKINNVLGQEELYSLAKSSVVENCQSPKLVNLKCDRQLVPEPIVGSPSECNALTCTRSFKLTFFFLDEDTCTVKNMTVMQNSKCCCNTKFSPRDVCSEDGMMRTQVYGERLICYNSSVPLCACSNGVISSEIAYSLCDQYVSCNGETAEINFIHHVGSGCECNGEVVPHDFKAKCDGSEGPQADSMNSESCRLMESRGDCYTMVYTRFNLCIKTCNTYYGKCNNFVQNPAIPAMDIFEPVAEVLRNWFNVGSIEECRKDCADNDYCHSFEWSDRAQYNCRLNFFGLNDYAKLKLNVGNPFGYTAFFKKC